MTFKNLFKDFSKSFLWHYTHSKRHSSTLLGKSSESAQCAMLKACDACADMGQ